MGQAAILPVLGVPFRVPGDLRVDYQKLLTQTAHLLLQDCDADTLCQSVFELIRGPFQLDVYFHYLVSDDQKSLRLASCGGSEAARAALGSELHFGQAVCGAVAESCEWMYVTDIQRRRDEMTRMIREFGVRSYTCQPLVLKGELLGTLSFGSCRRDSFEPEELQLFQLIAQQVNVVTERRQQSEYMRQLEQLATVGRMCATIAHEINNPLECLNNLLYLVQSEVNTKDGQWYVQQAEQQVSRLAETTQRTLDLFRGKQQLPRVVDLGQLVREMLANTPSVREIRLVPAIEEDLLVLAVPGELRQVLFNLVNNAMQFTPDGGQVLLTVERSGQGTAEIRVKDEGPGISEATRAKIFKPFYTTRANGGTGVGLWISREMVERIGGSLTFESEPTRRPGTEFIVTLPLAVEHAA